MAVESFARTLIIRFTWSTSYSAYELIRVSSPPLLLTGLVPLFICGVVYCKQIEGLQSLCAILVAQGITTSLPIPYEPSGYLVIPSVLLYFAVVCAVCFRLSGGPADAVIEQFVSLFATVRALAYFKEANQIEEVGVLSFAFLCIPTGQESTGRTWFRQMLRTIECFTARAAATWVASRCEAWAQGVQLMSLYAVILLTPMDLMPKLANCRSVLALLCAQQALVLLPFVEPFIAALAVPLVRQTRLREVALYGASIVLSKRLDDWAADCGRAESACAYLCIFALLQAFSNFIAEEERWVGFGHSSILRALISKIMIQAYTRDPSILFRSVSHTSSLLPSSRGPQPVFYRDATLLLPPPSIPDSTNIISTGIIVATTATNNNDNSSTTAATNNNDNSSTTAATNNNDNSSTTAEMQRHHSIAVDWYKGTVTGYLDSSDAINHVPSFTTTLPECAPSNAEQYVRETFEFLRRGHSLFHPECRCRPRRRSHELGFRLWHHDNNSDEYCSVGTTGQGRSVREIERELGVRSLYGLIMAGGEMMPLMQVLVRLAGLRLHTEAAAVLLSSPICCIPPEIITGDHIVAAARALYPRAFVCTETCFGDLARLESTGILRVIPIASSPAMAVFWRPSDEHIRVDSDIQKLWHQTIAPIKKDVPSFFGYDDAAKNKKRPVPSNTQNTRHYRLLVNNNNPNDDADNNNNGPSSAVMIDATTTTTPNKKTEEEEDENSPKKKKMTKKRAPLRLYGSRRR